MENRYEELQTERLVLREFRETDWQPVYEYRSDPEVSRYMDFNPNTEHESKTFINVVLANQRAQPRQTFNFALINRANNKLIGGCTLRITGIENKEGDIGYILNRHYWNKGYVTEAAARVVSFGFEQLGLHRIYSTCYPANTASYRVMEKIGMHKEGCLRETRFIKGVWCDSLLYSILENEWRKRKDDSTVKPAGRPAENLAFQQAGESDLDTILDIYNFYIITSTAGFDLSQISKEEFCQRIFINHEKYGVFLIRCGAELAGFCYINQFKRKKAYDRTAETGLYLKPEFTGKGIGKKAVAFLEKTALSRQINVLVTSISGENTASIKLMQKLGYEKCAHYKQVGEKFGRLLDVVDYQKILKNV
jgi:[ribosomal protein S5]-alanine N-acetyltransferase